MSGRALFRLSGVALITAGIGGAIASVVHLQYHPPKPAEVLLYVSKSEPVHALLFAAILLVLLGLLGLLIRQQEKTGAGGVAGFILVLLRPHVR